MNTLSFEQLRNANIARGAKWHPGFPETDTGWNLADWANALGGESGELAEAVELLLLITRVSVSTGNAQNNVKKVRREEENLSNVGDPKVEKLVADIGEELADVITYCDLLATKLGIDLGDAVAQKFNKVSNKQGFNNFLPVYDPADVWRD